MTDARDGSMTSVTGPMPPAQQEIYDGAPVGWQTMPRIGVSDAILRALTERGLVETRWKNGTLRQWRKTDDALIAEGTWERRDGEMICLRGKIINRR